MNSLKEMATFSAFELDRAVPVVALLSRSSCVKAMQEIVDESTTGAATTTTNRTVTATQIELSVVSCNILGDDLDATAGSTARSKVTFLACMTILACDVEMTVVKRDSAG